MNKGYTIKRQLRFTELTEGFVNSSSSYLASVPPFFLAPVFTVTLYATPTYKQK